MILLFLKSFTVVCRRSLLLGAYSHHILLRSCRILLSYLNRAYRLMVDYWYLRRANFTPKTIWGRGDALVVILLVAFISSLQRRKSQR